MTSTETRWKFRHRNPLSRHPRGVWETMKIKSAVKDLTTGSPMRLILGFAVPMLLGLLFQQFYSMVDAIVVGKWIGVGALASVGATGSVNFMINGFCTGLCTGFAIPVAQRFGAGDLQSMRKFVTNIVWTAAVIGCVLTVVVCLLCRNILVWMKTPTDIIDGSYSYIFWIFLGIPVTLLYNLVAGIIRALGDSTTPVIFLILAALINIGLDIVSVVVMGCGVEGPAIATVISQAVSGVLCLIYMKKKFTVLRMEAGEWRPDARCIRVLLSSGVPMGLQYSITAIGSVILQSSVNELGSAAVASVTAGGKVNLFFTCPFDALGGTMATWAGQNIGAGKPERVHRGLLGALLLGGIYSVAACAVLIFFGKNVALLFLDSNETEILANAQLFLTVNSAAYLLLLCVNVFRFCIQGMGYSLFAVTAGVFEMAARSIVGFGLVPRLGFRAVCFANPLAWLMADLFLVPAYLLCLGRVRRRLARVSREKIMSTTETTEKESLP